MARHAVVRDSDGYVVAISANSVSAVTGYSMVPTNYGEVGDTWDGFNFQRPAPPPGDPPDSGVPDPNPQLYGPGSFTVTMEKYVILANHLNLVTTQRVTLEGTSQLRMV